MSKQILFNIIDGLGGRIIFNYVVKNYDDPDNSFNEYYPAAIQFYCIAKGSGADRKLENIIPLGAKKLVEYTGREIYSKVAAKLGLDVATQIKNLYVEGIDDDISQ